MRKLIFYTLLSLMVQLSFSQEDLSATFKSKNYKQKLSLLRDLSGDQVSKNLEVVSSVLEQIKKEAEKNNDFYALSQVELFYGGLYYYEKRHDKAIPTLNNLLSNSTLLSSEDSVQLLYFLKNSYVSIKNSAKAFETHRMIEGIRKRIKNIDANFLDPPLSVLYKEMGLYQSAVAELKKEFEANAAKYNNNNITLAQYYNNLGVFFNLWNKYDSAAVYFAKANYLIKKELVKKPDDKNLLFFEGLTEGNIGSVLIGLQKYNEAIPKLRKDIHWSLETNNLESAGNSYSALASCYSKLGQHELARHYIDTAFVLYSRLNNFSPELKAHRVNAEIYKAAKNYKSATEEYEIYNKLRDSILEADKLTQMINEQVAFELDEKVNQLKEQKLKLEENERVLEKNKSDKLLLALLSIAIAAISIILFLGYRNSNKKQKELAIKNDEILAKNKLIEQSLAEKEALIKEVHHRVKNNLQIISSLLRLQSAKQVDEHVQEMFDDSVKRIQSMALVHELLYKNKTLVAIPIHAYIENLATGLSEAYGLNKHIDIHVDSDFIQLDIDTTIPLGLIINELVTNSIKHAFDEQGGRIDVKFKQHNHKFYLLVQDTGKGLPANFESIKENSLGMELVEALSDQINAIYKYSSDKGSKFEFEFEA
ncbi:MAG TPA: sensor histidine kinase [Bacteroidia bacterium]